MSTAQTTHSWLALLTKLCGRTRRAGRQRGARATILTLVAQALFCLPLAQAQLTPEQTYFGVNRPVPMTVTLPDGSGRSPQIELYQPGQREPIATVSVAEGRIDLAAMIPLIWTRQNPGLLYAQLTVDHASLGPAVVLQPLRSPPIATDQLTAAISDALKSGDTQQINTLLALTPARQSELRQAVRTTPLDHETYSGLRAWVDRHVVLETTAGDIELRLRPDHAPNTSFHFLQLVEGGFYNDTIIHRVISADARGRPFIIQAGDPTGLGFGGPGFRVDYEPSTLPHDFGVISLARQPFAPNSGGSQFFICLSREACAPLDGLYTSFAEAVDGADTISTISRVEVGPIDPDNPSSPNERPLDPPKIIRAFSTPAPPITQTPSRVLPPTSNPER